MIQDHVSNRRYRNTFEDNDGLDWQGQRGEIQGGGVWAGRVEGREAEREREIRPLKTKTKGQRHLS